MHRGLFAAGGRPSEVSLELRDLLTIGEVVRSYRLLDDSGEYFLFSPPVVARCTAGDKWLLLAAAAAAFSLSVLLDAAAAQLLLK